MVYKKWIDCQIDAEAQLIASLFKHWNCSTGQKTIKY